VHILIATTHARINTPHVGYLRYHNRKLNARDELSMSHLKKKKNLGFKEIITEFASRCSIEDSLTQCKLLLPVLFHLNNKFYMACDIITSTAGDSEERIPTAQTSSISSLKLIYHNFNSLE